MKDLLLGYLRLLRRFSAIKDLAIGERLARELHRLGDVIAMRINAGQQGDLGLLINFLKLTASEYAGEAVRSIIIILLVCARRLSSHFFLKKSRN